MSGTVTFRPGDKALVWRDGQYVPCILLSSRHVHLRYCDESDPEWHYQFDPRPAHDPLTGITPSTGGYTTKRFLKPRPEEATK